MVRNYPFVLFLLIGFILFPFIKLNAQETVISEKKRFDFTIRIGQGGFNDVRSDIDKLGGGQIALDIKLSKYPIAISFFTEYYTNSPDPTHSYEIANLNAVNIVYIGKPFKTDRINIFAGGGLGRLEVPKDGTNDLEKGLMYNLEAGINVRAFWKIGFYGMYKYLYANKEVNNLEVIDFNEHIFMLGITFSFSL